MIRWLRYSIVPALAFFSPTRSMAQVSMPDTVCVGTTRTYHVNDPTVPSTYTWEINGVIQTNATNAITITWNTPGIYPITVQEHSAGGCDGDVQTGLVYVRSIPIANAGADMTLCFGTTQRLNGTGGNVYQWSPSSNLSNATIPNPVFSSPSAGVFTYVLDVSDVFGCRTLKKDTVVITVLPPVKIFAGNDTTAAMNVPLQLNAADITNSNFVSYSWSPSFGLNNALIKDPVATLSSDQTFVVTAKTANGCEAKDDINIKVFAHADLFVPNAFTPNGDSKNDVLKVIPVGIKELKYFSIYNRWGQLVFTTRDFTKGWDGKLNGKNQDTFVFVWMAEATDYQGTVIKKKGTVVLIR